MIATVLRVQWLNLARDRAAQALTFVLPIAFFSIFALIFGSQGGGGMSRVRVVVVDEDGSDASRRLAAALAADGGLNVVQLPGPADQPPTRARAEAAVRDGKQPAVVVIPRGFGEGFGHFDGSGAAVELLVDRSNPVAGQMVAGLLQRAAMTAAPDLMLQRGLDAFEKHAGGLTSAQRVAVDSFLPHLRAASQPAPASAPTGAAGAAAGFGTPVLVRIVDVVGQTREQKSKPIIAFYAAGTAVMFLLFSATGAGSSLLEEQESGTLERLLSTRLGMTRLLAGKWIFITILGVAQITLMFVWGALVFGLDLFTPQHLAGFAVMTVATAMAASSFGLILATACRSRAQLGGLSTIVILMMSALGGSMFPRFLMSETLQKVGYVTFNAWALDGYQKVFWYDKGLLDLWPQLGVLLALAVVFMIVARGLARRWETV